MSDHFIFGYGSLVNRDTHAYPEAHPARLSGWRRIWRHTTRRQVAFLNVVLDAGSEIAGMMLSVPREEPELAQREYAYGRVIVTDRVSHALPGLPEVNVFAITEGEVRAPSTDHAILMSYVDMVAGGYFREFGAAGLSEFFETTDGWDAPILNDRTAPRYPRHREQDPEVIERVDEALSRLPSRIVPL